MATALTADSFTVENLASHPARIPRRTDWLRRFMSLEAWLDERASRRALYRLDEAALADLGLSRADAERIARPSHP